MVYTITTECIACDACRRQCPRQAISARGKRYYIDKNLCNNCLGYYPDPLCIIVCPTLHPVPLESDFSRKIKRRRCNWSDKESPKLFPDGQKNPVALSPVIWEACNILAQRDSLPWKTDEDGKLFYCQKVKPGKELLYFRLAENVENEPPRILSGETARQMLDLLDIRSACMHLIYAAYATVLKRPWQQTFIIDDREIETYLGIDKRKDLTRQAKLGLIKFIARQPCQLTNYIRSPSSKQVKTFTLEETRLWHLLSIEHHFSEDPLGNKHIIGLKFTLKAGIWSRYFLNYQEAKERKAFERCGILPKFILDTVTSIWQQREGAARMLLWLLFKIQQKKESEIQVSTLMKVAYGEEKVRQIHVKRVQQKKQIEIFEKDLQVLFNCGFQPIFDTVSYPPAIQPFWTESYLAWNRSETDFSPRQKWQMLMSAKLFGFKFPLELEEALTDWEEHQQPKIPCELSGEQIMRARKNKGLSQRRLAAIVGKSQSWVRDVENARHGINSTDRERLKRILGLST
ncbi:helix-turn-helix domain-containing protein [Pleurocapsales cyanobacterium LEGE 06147]|nr:helix-turn-helix domain-containing protein [Pleurocapsales cyanobacterium LEGE 06147]